MGRGMKQSPPKITPFDFRHDSQDPQDTFSQTTELSSPPTHKPSCKILFILSNPSPCFTVVHFDRIYKIHRILQQNGADSKLREKYFKSFIDSILKTSFTLRSLLRAVC